MSYKRNKDLFIPYFSGNIFLTKCMGQVSLEAFINAHQNPKQETINILNKIKIAEQADDKELKRSLKQNLYSFTPSVIIPKGMKRRYSEVVGWTGLMQLDFDKLTDEKQAEELRDYLFNTYKQVVTTYLSPSRKGVKALLKTTTPKDKKHYKALHKAVIMEMEQLDCFDQATTNAMLPLFLSRDKDILYRDIEDCYTWNDEDHTEIEYVQLVNEPTNFDTSSDEKDYLRTVKIFENKIQNIFSEGHTQLRSACLILGSRVGAGYISESEAKQLANQMINANGYLNKDLANYHRTANWCILQGINNPKYYN